MFPLTLALLASCGSDKGRAGMPGEDFAYDDTVRVTDPSNGATVEPTFTVSFESGAGVKGLRLDADDVSVAGPLPSDEAGDAFVVTLEDGRHALALVGLDRSGEELSRHELTVRVASDLDSSWVTITSPADGATVTNPVTFAVEASADIDAISFEADDWSIGSATAGGTLTYEFSGTGYERRIEAIASSGGEVVATDEIAIVVEDGTTPDTSDFDDVVMGILESYPTDGTNDYYWPEGSDWAGTTRDVWYQDTLVAEGDPQGRCYCVGLTWELYMRSFDEVDRATGGDGSLNGISVDELYVFRTDWYVRDLYGAGVADAMDNYGLGDRVTDMADLRPGDFVQFWRHSGSGHNVVFIDWELDSGGNIDGILYWACSSGTDGIGYQSEYFGSSGSTIDPSYFFAARGRMPEDWESWE